MQGSGTGLDTGRSMTTSHAHSSWCDIASRLPLRTVRAICTAHGSSKPLTSHSVARLSCPEDTRSQVANELVDAPPVDGVPVGSFLGSVCSSQRRHRTCPLIGSLHRVLRVAHQTHVSRLSTGPEALSAGLWIPLVFRRAAFASWVFMSRRGCAFFLRRGYRSDRTATGFPRSAPERYDRDGCLLYSGIVVSNDGMSKVPPLAALSSIAALIQSSSRQPSLATNLS